MFFENAWYIGTLECTITDRRLYIDLYGTYRICHELTVEIKLY